MNLVKMREILIKPSIAQLSTSNVTNTPEDQKKIVDLISNGCVDFTYSVELCPNRHVDFGILSNIQPKFCSVTWLELLDVNNEVGGIPGLSLIKQLQSEGYHVLLHLPGRNFDKDKLLCILRSVKEIGVKNILALQGDSPRNAADDTKCDFPYASDLVAFIKENFNDFFCIGVAAYPEKHSASQTLAEDLFYLKNKVLQGAEFIITQATFDYNEFESFSMACRKLSINVPIFAGLFVISSHEMLTGMAKICQMPVPEDVLENVSKSQGDNEKIEEYGIGLAKEFIDKISCNKVARGVHFFSLNNLRLVNEVVKT